MTGRFHRRETRLAGLTVLVGKVIEDERGSLERLYSADDLREIVGDRSIVHVNRTRTRRRGTVRGLHAQSPPHAEMKLIRCLRGKVFDVAVDVRQGSPTFLRWHGEEIGEAEPISVAIPEGFAHGFQALTDDCELLYLHTASYEPAAEIGLHVLDPVLAIQWPLDITAISPRDASHPLLTGTFVGIPS